MSEQLRDVFWETSDRLHEELIALLRLRNDLAKARELARIVLQGVRYLKCVDRQALFLSPSYVSRQIKSDLVSLSKSAPFHGMSSEQVDRLLTQSHSGSSSEYIDQHVKRSLEKFPAALEDLRFNYNLYESLGFLKTNTVIVGANGSGKSEMAERLRRHAVETALPISAQKILSIPRFNSIKTPKDTKESVESVLRTEAGYKSRGSYRGIGETLGVMIQHLISDHYDKSHRYRDDAKRDQVPDLVDTQLEKAISVWSDLIEHRELVLEEFNLRVTGPEGIEYDPIQLSDGEKAVLFFIVSCLNAPRSGIIFVDEPEMYLHATIRQRLWDRLEQERSDCVFVYLTHDIDFAVRRSDANHMWIRRFRYPDSWEFESIEANEFELPHSLLLSILGSRRNIVLCEGVNDGLDFQLLSSALPEATIKPVEGKLNVIRYTRTYNQLRIAPNNVFGLIDRDHLSDGQIKSYERSGVYCLSLTEVENLILRKEFLEHAATKWDCDPEATERAIEAITDAVSSQLEKQAIEKVAEKVNWMLEEKEIPACESKESLRQEINVFTSELDVTKWVDEESSRLRELVEERDYDKLLANFKSKRRAIAAVSQEFKVNDYRARAIRLVRQCEHAQSLIRGALPEGLLRALAENRRER